jgi:transcriptional regulator with XRE-family HTH domain
MGESTEVEPCYQTFGRLLAEARKRKGQTQQELADVLSMNRASIANIERGAQRILLHDALQAARLLGLRLDDLPAWPLDAMAGKVAAERKRKTTLRAKIRALQAELKSGGSP